MKITEHTHALKHHFQIPISTEMKVDRFVYSYIVFGKEGIYLVDCGVSAASAAIFDYIIQNGRLFRPCIGIRPFRFCAIFIFGVCYVEDIPYRDKGSFYVGKIVKNCWSCTYVFSNITFRAAFSN